MHTPALTETAFGNTTNLLTLVEAIRQDANTKLDESRRGQMGQFMTPDSVAAILASMFDDLSGDLAVLDAGAGVGSLTAALTHRATNEFQPTSITATCYELEPVLADNLNSSLDLCNSSCIRSKTQWESSIHQEDFIQSAVTLIKAHEAGDSSAPRFNKAILNPPYLKISAKSKERQLLREVGIETGNLYSGFVALAIKLLEPGGELVAITPRSFCNGPYFKGFRDIIFEETSLRKLTVFGSRKKAFKGDKVLQENVVFHLVKGGNQSQVQIRTLSCPDDTSPIVRMATIEDVINPSNPDRFIHIVTTDEEAQVAHLVGGLPSSLSDLGIEVSTGKVVGFRTKQNLRQDATPGTAPLIYPLHFSNGRIQWPIHDARKPNALALNENTKNLMVQNGTYVLTKRLTAKEENRRIVAAVYEPTLSDGDVVGFENKTNYFHSFGRPLDKDVAEGLSVFLNSSIVDQYFRQFNGHTQVNATDLRSLRYPSLEKLKEIGNEALKARKSGQFDNSFFTQELIDELVERAL